MQQTRFTSSLVIKGFAAIVCLFALSACTRGELQGCEGPAISSEVISARTGASTSGPRGYLVLPNPIDATGNPTASVSSTDVLNSARMMSLADLTSSSILQNAFLKIRLESMNDSLSSLAKPNASGEFSYRIEDPHYSEVMAYQSITGLRRYVKALGFGLDESRPLYVTVQTKQSGVSSSTVNAYYVHNYFDTTAPRQIKLFGNGTQYAPGQDRQVYWHEFGHFVNESVSRQVGMDFAGDSGAIYTEGSALHECLADFLGESVADTSYIGKWIAPNYEGFSKGQPLRSAADTTGQRLTYSQVALADGTGNKPERYAVAEWCSRVLWDLRKTFVAESSTYGAARAEMLMLSALSLVSKDTSISKYRDAVLKADQQLFCGGHQNSITQAFESRGFAQTPAKLSTPLNFQATIYGINSSNQTTTSVSIGQEFTFRLKIANPNNGTARNVRVRLESLSAKLLGTTYEQGFGDLAPSRSLDVGSSSGLSFDYSVYGMIDSTAVRGSKLTYQLRLISENAPDTILRGEIQL